MQEDVRGSRFYEDHAVRTRYLAHRHGGVRSPNHVMEEPAFLAALGSVAGKRAVDLGCGDGSTARTIIDLGAVEYIGIDGSAAMISTARESHSLPGSRFVHQDIEDVALGEEEYDVVVSRMALHYVERLGPVLQRIRQALRPCGRLVFTVTHPVITSHDSQHAGPRTTWTVDNYFTRGPRERPWFGSTVTWHHRTIEDYLRLVLDSDLHIDTISECEPDAELLAGHEDELLRRQRVPMILLIGATRRDQR
jgi:SAM-dependent methyltransferase